MVVATVVTMSTEERSQDGGLGGCGIHVSAQLGHLPDTGGGPRTPKKTGGTPSDWVGHGACGGVRGEEKWRQDGTGTLRGGCGRGRDPTPEGGN